MVSINNKPAMMLRPKVLPTRPPPVTFVWYESVLENILAKAAAHIFNEFLRNYNERLLDNILSFM